MTDKRLNTDPDFVAVKRFGHSLKRLLTRYPDSVPNDVAAQALELSEAELEIRYQKIIEKLRNALGE